MRKLFMICMITLVAGCGSPQSSQDSTAVPATQTAVLPSEKSANTEAGIKFLQAGDIASAIKSFEAAIKEDPENVSNYIILGETYMHIKNFNRAIDTFVVATHIDPQNAQAHFMLATNLGIVGNYDLAKLEAQKSAVIFQQNKNDEKFKRAVALYRGLDEAGQEAQSATK